MAELFLCNCITLVQVMAWCRQATSHYLSHCWPRSMASLCHNELINIAVLYVCDQSCIWLSGSLLISDRKLQSGMAPICDDSLCFATPTTGYVVKCTWTRSGHTWQLTGPARPEQCCENRIDILNFGHHLSTSIHCSGSGTLSNPTTNHYLL